MPVLHRGTKWQGLQGCHSATDLQGTRCGGPTTWATRQSPSIPFCRKRETGTRKRNKKPEKQGFASQAQVCKTESPAHQGRMKRKRQHLASTGINRNRTSRQSRINRKHDHSHQSRAQRKPHARQRSALACTGFRLAYPPWRDTICDSSSARSRDLATGVYGQTEWRCAVQQ